MANTPVVVLDDTLTNIANAIRGKNGSSNKYKPGQMADAIDNIPAGGIGIPREVSNGVYQRPEITSFSLPSNATDVGPNALAYAFDSYPNLTSVDLSHLTTVSGERAFYNAFHYCRKLTSVDLSSLTTVSGVHSLNGAFDGCTSLTSVDLSSLTTVSSHQAFANTFRDCSNITSVDLSSLTTLSGKSALSYAFSGCTAITSVNLSSLTTVSGGVFTYTFRDCRNITSVNFSSLATMGGGQPMWCAFYGCSKLASLSFPALTADSFGSAVDQFDNMLSGVTGCTVHFPAAIQAKIETMKGYPNFGGTNTTVLFDL